MRQFRLFSLFGFEIKLDLSWLLMALLISWSLGAGYFPSEYPGLPRQVYAWMGVACAIGVFFSIVFHEFSHSIIARYFGMPIKGITLFIFGGIAEMEKEPPSPKSEFFMAIAGPLASFLLAFLLYQIKELAAANDWSVAVTGVSGMLAYINMVVAIFNLVPAFPLDGGRIFRAILWYWKKDMRAATQFSSQMGNGFGVVLMVLGVIALFQGNFIGGMWWILIGIFLRNAAASSYQQVLLQEILGSQPVAHFMNREPVTVAPSISIQDWVEDYVYRYHFKMFPVVEDSRLVGCISIESIKQLPKDDWKSKNVGDLMQVVASTNSVPANTNTADLLSKMIRPDAPSRYMVTDNDQLVGMISLKDLMELIALKMEIEPATR